MAQLTRRTQLLLDDDLHQRLRRIADERGVSLGALIREAIAEKLTRVQDARGEAFKRLLEAEPMPVEDWSVMKKEILDSHYAKVEKLYGEDE